MSQMPKWLWEERDKFAESYPAQYEMLYMNADTPRLSGAEYLKHGYKQGFDQCHRIMAEREAKRMKKVKVRQAVLSKGNRCWFSDGLYVEGEYCVSPEWSGWGPWFEIEVDK